MKAGRILLAWAAAIATLAVVVATSDPDPEGLAVGPQHLEQVLADEATKAGR